MTSFFGGSPKDYLALTKPRLTSLALATVVAGFFMGSSGGVNHTRFFWLLLGSTLIGGGANSLNQYFERDIDARMKRTERRPLPSGKLLPRAVLVFGAALALAGVAVLFVCTRPLAGWLGALTLLSYVFFYTPLKRVTTLNTFVGAVPGALPVVMGWAAAAGSLDFRAWTLFLILFVWQLPHFYSIAWVYREDYIQGGLRMVGGGDADGRRTAWSIFFYSVALLLASLLPTAAGLSGGMYFAAAAAVGLIFSALALRLVVRRMEGAKKFVAASIFYLVAIILTMMADKI